MTRTQQGICSAYKSGMLIVDIMERFSTHRAALYKLLRAADIPHRHRKPQRDARMQLERREGMSVTSLALKYGITAERVRQILKSGSLRSGGGA